MAGFSGSQAICILAMYETTNVPHSMLGDDQQCSNKFLLLRGLESVCCSLRICLSSLCLWMQADKIWDRILLLAALQLPNECRGMGDLLECPLNTNKEMHHNADGVFGLCHLPRKAEDVCEHTYKLIGSPLPSNTV